MKKQATKRGDKRLVKDLPARNAKSVRGGSATGGAGAGKIKFNEFQITKTTDQASPLSF
jgi:hypothetical protein